MGSSGSAALTGADRRNTWSLCRRHCISVGRDQHRKLSWLSDVHIIVKSLVIDGLRLGSGQPVPPPPPPPPHNGCAVAALDLQAQINKGCVRHLRNGGERYFSGTLERKTFPTGAKLRGGCYTFVSDTTATRQVMKSTARQNYEYKPKSLLLMFQIQILPLQLTTPHPPPKMRKVHVYNYLLLKCVLKLT